MSLLFYTFLHTIALVIAQKEAAHCEKGEGGGSIHSNGIGTVLFTAADEFKQCWSPDEIAILTARMIMEDLLPDVAILNIDSNGYADDIVGYFRLLIEVVKKSTHGRKKRITLLVLTDILGGYLQFAVLPIARRAFYAGLIDYNSMEKLIQLFEELKWFLRTNGQGWSKPLDSTPEFDIQQIDFETESPKVKNCCNQLIFYEYEHKIKQDNRTITKSDIAYPMPFFDTSVKPSSIAVPFKKFAMRNIESRRASYFLLKFFITAWQCLNERGSTKEAKLKFQNSLFTWLQTNVIPKIKDDKFYSAFGGVLRVVETLKAMGAVTHVESTCAPEGEEEVAVPESGSRRSFTSTVVLVVMLIIIFIWFIIGTAFVCFRMKKGKKGDDSPSKKSDFTSTEESKWSAGSKGRSDSNKTDTSIGICRCSNGSRTSPYSSSLTSEYEIDDKNKKKRSKQSKEKSVTICYPPFMAPYMDDKPATIETKATMKMLPSIEEMTEITSHRNDTRSHQRTRDDSAPSRTSEEKRDFRKSKKDYDTAIPCKHYPQTSGTSSSRRPSWESVRKKIKPGTKIDECWCDILEEETEEMGSDELKKSTRKSSVEFATQNVPERGKGKRGQKERGAKSGDSSRQMATTMEDSNVIGKQNYYDNLFYTG